MIPTVGSKWISRDRKKNRAVVRGIEEYENTGTYVLWGRHGQDTTYEAPLEFFLALFEELTDETK